MIWAKKEIKDKKITSQFKDLKKKKKILETNDTNEKENKKQKPPSDQCNRNKLKKKKIYIRNIRNKWYKQKRK